MSAEHVELSRKLEALLGRPVIRVNGKHALDKRWQQAAEEPERHRRLLRDHDGNVALVCGGGLVVVDVDLYKPEGQDSLDRLRAAGLPYLTYTCLTGGGGLHLYYWTEEAIGCSAPADYPGIEIKGEGGYVVIPPSIHASGKPYEWEFGYSPFDDEATLAHFGESMNKLFGGARQRTAGPIDERDEAALNLLLEHFGGHSPVRHADYIEVTRPGKDAKAGGSATVGKVGRGVTYVFSSNWPPFTQHQAIGLSELRRLAGVPGPKIHIPEAETGTSFVLGRGLPTSLQRWLLDGLIPLGELTLAAGQEKLGKSTAMVWVAARVTKGELQGHLLGKPRSVVYVSAEDHYTRVLLPRFDVAGADRGRVYLLNPDGPGFSVAAVRALGPEVGLIVMDPLSMFLNVPANNEHGEIVTRNALAPFVYLSQELEAGLVGVRHFSKGSHKDNPYDLIMGSRGYTAAARSVLFFLPDREQPDRPGGLLFARGNLAVPSPGIRYRLDIEQYHYDDGNVGPVPHFVRDEMPVTITLEEALAATSEQGRLVREVAAWLIDLLGDGRLDRQVVIKLAERQGFTGITLKRAKKKSGVRTEKEGFGPEAVWYWVLP